jgi:type IV secretory pathway VirB4 component
MGNSFSNPPMVPKHLIQHDIEMIELSSLCDKRINKLETKINNINIECVKYDYITEELHSKMDELYITAKDNRREVTVNRNNNYDTNIKYNKNINDLEEKICIITDKLDYVLDKLDKFNEILYEDDLEDDKIYKKNWQTINEINSEWDNYMENDIISSQDNEQ